MICYLNTDLDLIARYDLTSLAEALKAQGIHPLHVTRGEDGQWYAIFETDEQYDQPDANLAAMLAVIESLPDSSQAIWRACTKREFNIGYDCGTEPWAFNNGLSCETLRRMAEVGAGLRITLYPARPDHQ